MLTRILILLLLLNINGFSQKKIPVKIDVKLSGGDTTYNINIVSQLTNGSETINRKGIIQRVEGVQFNDEIIFSGSVTQFEIKADNLSEIYKFDLSGEEDSIRIFSILNLFGDHLKIQSINVSKYYDGSKLAHLIPDWNFKQGTIPKYKIVNDAPGKNFYGTGGGNLFWSQLFANKKGEWVKDYISIGCGSNGNNSPINFNDTATADIPSYIPLNLYRDSKLIYPLPGEYKFITPFTETEYLPISDPVSGVRTFTSIVYTISTEFEIK